MHRWVWDLRLPPPRTTTKGYPIGAVPHRTPRDPQGLWVPPGHRRDWRHHCRQYGACGAPVYFVQDGWYREHVIVRRDGPPHRHAGGSTMIWRWGIFIWIAAAMIAESREPCRAGSEALLVLPGRFAN